MSEKRKGIFYGWYILIICVLMAMAGIGLVNAMGVFFPVMMRTFGFSSAAVSGIFSCVMLGSLLGSLTLGNLYKKKSTRTLMLVLGIFHAGPFFVMAYAGSNLLLYYIGAVVAGWAYCGTATITVPLLITKWFDVRRSTAMGIAYAGTGLSGFFMAPVLTKVLYGSGGISGAFITLASIITACLLLGVIVVRNSPADIGLKPLGHNEGDKQSEKEANAPKQIGEPIGFTLKESMKMGSFWLMGVVMFILGLSCTSVLVQIATHMIGIGYTPVVATFAISLYAISNTAGKVVLGMIIDKVGIYKSNYFAFPCWGLGIISLVLLAKSSLFIYVFVVLAGIGIPIASVSIAIMVGDMFGTKNYANIWPIQLFFFSAGLVPGPIVSGAIFDATGSFAPAFLGIGVLVLISLVLTQFSYKSTTKKLNQFKMNI